MAKIISVFKGKTDNTLLQLFRYSFVGGFAFLIDFGTLFILTEYCHLYYLVSAGLAFILGLMVNYFLSLKWVFNSRTIGNRWLEFLFFSAIGLIGLGLNELFLWILTDFLAIYYLISKIITTFIVYFWNFFARKMMLFNKKNLNYE
ncbi:MAG: GtrA family protein [Ignavibacteriaceae bacterium]|nr:GtrA family protein [Ignavibacteriaceae bacterium]